MQNWYRVFRYFTTNGMKSIVITATYSDYLPFSVKCGNEIVYAHSWVQAEEIAASFRSLLGTATLYR